MTNFIPLAKALRFLDELRRLDPEMSSAEAHILLAIARHPGISQVEIGLETRLGKSSVSRYVDSLGEREGRGFVSVREAPEDRRLNLTRLTPTGEAFVKRITGFL